MLRRGGPPRRVYQWHITQGLVGCPIDDVNSQFNSLGSMYATPGPEVIIDRRVPDYRQNGDATPYYTAQIGSLMGKGVDGATPMTQPTPTHYPMTLDLPPPATESLRPPPGMRTRKRTRDMLPYPYNYEIETAPNQWQPAQQYHAGTLKGSGYFDFNLEIAGDDVGRISDGFVVPEYYQFPAYNAKFQRVADQRWMAGRHPSNIVGYGDSGAGLSGSGVLPDPRLPRWGPPQCDPTHADCEHLSGSGASQLGSLLGKGRALGCKFFPYRRP
ncbi:pVIII [White sturgeon adenovirus 1]|uniref:PVIII n=1 Tax=White sturgeon adenovirus 1 TaxID=2580388 RepID=A0A4P8PSA2_9ADEN|nr:pVIII [White sturgeon adenovirus 1]QCQ84164.1 pVIII [White sturgeon adenovirus 1]